MLMMRIAETEYYLKWLFKVLGSMCKILNGSKISTEWKKIDSVAVRLTNIISDFRQLKKSRDPKYS